MRAMGMKMTSDERNGVEDIPDLCLQEEKGAEGYYMPGTASSALDY